MLPRAYVRASCALLCILLALSTALLQAVAAADLPQDKLLRMDFEGRQRLCLVHLPKAYEPRTKRPLLICLHGAVSSYRNAIKTFGLNDEADKESFIIAYPNGTSRFGQRLATWNAGGCCGYAADHKINDVGFVRSLIASLEQNYAIDENRIYLVGFSNGGMLAYSLAAEMPGVFAGLAVLSGWMNGQQQQLSKPVSAFIVHGSEDKSVPLMGGSGKWARYGIELGARPLNETVAYWIRNDGCSSVPQVTKSGALTRYLYAGGRGGTEVELCLIEGYGHAWPGGRKSWLFAAKPYSLFSANDALWEFLSKHSTRDGALNAEGHSAQTQPVHY